MLIDKRGTLRVYLVRHGETVWNREGRLQGHTDVPLSEAGTAQARLIAARLADEPIAAVWTSDMARARLTAETIAEPHGLHVRPTPLLRESCLGDWEGLTRDEIVARDPALWEAYHQDSAAHRPPNGEQLEEVWYRLQRAMDEVRRSLPAGTAVIVGHGGSLRALLCEALGAPIPSMRRIWLDNASVSLIEHAPGRVWVRLVNDTCHLRHGQASPRPGPVA